MASLFPLLGNAVSLVCHRQVDIIGILVLSGFAVSITGILLGGSQRLLLIQESFVTGALGLVGLTSLVFPKPLGYFVAQYVMTTIAPEQRADSGACWRSCSFRQALRGRTLFWSLLLLSELLLRSILGYTLPISVAIVASSVVPLTMKPAGVAVTLIWMKSLLGQGRQEKKP